MHLVEGGGMPSLEMGLGDLGCLEVQARVQSVYQGTLAHSALAAEKHDLILAQGLQA